MDDAHQPGWLEMRRRDPEAFALAIKEAFETCRPTLKFDREPSAPVAFELADRFTSFLEAVAQGLQEFAARIAKSLAAAGPFPAKFASDVDRITAEPPVPGHEDYLIQEEKLDPVTARVLARNLRVSAEQLIADNHAERRLGGLIRKLAREKRASSLVISNHARGIAIALNSGTTPSALIVALSRKGIEESHWDFEQLVRTAATRDANACRRLKDVCSVIASELVNPRGRPLTVNVAVHVMLLALTDKAYTYDPVEGAFTDAATRATMLALGVKKFSPHAAWRFLQEENRRTELAFPQLP